MADSFSVDLDRLHNVAATDLPYIIGSVDGARGQLNTATGELPKAFDGTLYHTSLGQSGMLDRGSFGVGDYVEAVITDVITGLGKLSDNLELSKTAIREVANRYREADGQSPYPN